FSKIAKYLTILTQKCKTFDWGEEQELTFQTLKDKLCNAPVLALLDGPEDFVEVVDEYVGLQKGLDEMIEQRSNGTLYYLDRIWVPIKGEVRTLIMDEAHKSKYSVHLGADKMYYDFRDRYSWPGMKKDIAEYEVKLEKDGLDGKLAGLLKASKNLNHLIESQMSDQVKEGVGYNAVPPAAADLYLSPKKDLSWTGLPEFVDDTVTKYSRPSPTVVSTLTEGQNKDSSTSKVVASPNPPKPFVKSGGHRPHGAPMRPPLRSSGHRSYRGSMRPSHRSAGHRPHGPSKNPRRPTMNGVLVYAGVSGRGLVGVMGVVEKAAEIREKVVWRVAGKTG
nr:putative reverse transcriptase domain-containing protein [Tanacetum cinerariifolium]